jgi:hypothetical protein
LTSIHTAEYALQRVVKSFSNFHFTFAEYQLTHTYAVVFRFCQLEIIDYLVLKDLGSSDVPIEECSEEWLHDGET